MGSRARRYLIASAVLAALTLAGCPKKESPEDIEFAAQQARKAAQEKKKKVDVFDEFYVDDTKKAATGDVKAAKTKGKADAPAVAAVAPAPAVAARQQSALPASSGSQNFSKNGRYVVQVNSTASEAEAGRMAGKLKNLGYPAYVAAVQNPTPALTGTYFRVRLGGFDSYSEAKAFAEGTLSPAGYDYWVDRKANDNVGIQGAGFGSAGGQQQYQPAAQPQQPPPPPPQQYQPAPQPQQHQAAPAPAPQPAARPQQPPPPPPQQYQPAPQPQQHQAAPAPAPAPQPAARPQQPPPPPPQQYQPAPQPQQQAPAPAPAPQPTAKPQQAPAAPASKPAAQPKPSANEWGTTDDWGSADW
ncbi:hypothetical protein R80B4_00710 [Fibrobacteres bacterium R8-0-B4]